MSDVGMDVERSGDGVAWIVIRNPARHNALRLEMWRALPAIVADLDGDPSVRVAVLRGAGDVAFASGADVSEFETALDDPGGGARYEAITAEAFEAVIAFSKPLVGMIHGACIGGGLALALAADVRLAADDATFALPAARLGLGYHASGVERLVQMIGPAATAEMCFAALQYGADEARQMGLVNRVLPKADLEGFTRAYASAMAKNAPLSQAAAKAAIRDALIDPAHRHPTATAAHIVACLESEDYVEGVRAFLEKRRPVFRGR